MKIQIPTVIASLLLSLLPAHFAAADDFGCELNITGDQTLAIKAPQIKLDPAAQKTPEQVKAAGKVGSSTDYWLTESQTRNSLEMMIGMFSQVSFGKTPKPPMSAAEKKQKVDEAMKKDPRIILLLINCGDEQAGINIGPGRDAKYADLPFKPGTFEIAARPSAHQISVMTHINGAHGHEGYSVSGPGTFKLTQFDLQGIAGDFSYPAQQLAKDKKKIQVTGHFHLRCVGEKCEK